MIMQTERGFWSNVSVLPIKSDNKAHDSVTSLANLIYCVITICLIAIVLSCIRVVLRINVARNRIGHEINFASYAMVAQPVWEEEYRPIQSLSVLEVSSTTERDYATYTDTYSGEIRAIRMTRESITSQNATLINNDTSSDENARRVTRVLIKPPYKTLIHKVGKLLDENILPTNKDIQTLNKFCGRQSEGMKTLCKQICGVLKRKMYKDTATNIWPAWNLNSDKIVFVVESTKITKSSSTSHHTDLEIIENKGNCSAFEKESHMVMEKEKELLTNQTYDDIGFLQSLQNKVSTYSKELMDKHRNITAIFPSIVKSVGYLGSGKHRLIERLCISIRVEKKISGLIPLAEESIATNVGRFPTDVIEGDFRFFGGGPNDFHENVKIGSAIHAGLVTDNGELLGGTMGCFVKHKSFGLCCMASAHIILSQAEIKEVLKDGYCEYDKHSLKPVYQPIDNRLKQFGQVVSAACNEGHSNMAGVEVALIQIVSREPKSGSFPITDANKEHTFAFNTGNVADAKLLRPLTEVFKFGIETGPTFGLLGIPGVSVRYRGGFRLQNQVVVMPKKDDTFAEKGDSGSSAFIGVSCPGTEAAIGLVTGGFDSGQVLVTPIHAALSAVKCPPYLHRFEDAGGDSGFNDDIIEGCERMECN